MSLKYIIQQGDTLSQIAERLGVDMLEIAKNNNIKDVNKIYTGRTLTIPSKAEQEKVQIRNIQEKIQEPIRKDRESDSRTIDKIKPEVSNLFASASSKPTEPLFSWGDIKEFFTKERPERPEAKSLLGSPKTRDREEDNPFAIDPEPTKKETSSTLIPAPIKAVFYSFFDKGVGTTLTKEEIGEDVTNIVSQAAKTGLEAGRKNASYEDYPETARGLSAEALVGAVKYADGRPIPKDIRDENARMREEMYPKNLSGLTNFVYDVVTDPVVKAVLSVGGFSIHGGKGNYHIKDVFNFNTANISKDDWYAWVRNKLSNSGLMPITEDEGVKINLKIKTA